MDRATPHDGKQIPTDGPVGLAHYLDDLVLRVENFRHRSALSAALVLVAGVAIGAGWWLGRGEAVSEVEASIPFATTVVANAPPPTTGPLDSRTTEEQAAIGPAPQERDPASVEIVVHVSGAVKTPGLVRLPDGSRVADAVEAAGGPSGEGDIHQLNLATLLVDGSQVVVPAEGEVAPGPLIRLPGATELPAGQPQGRQGLIDLNQASAAEFETLPGVGPATANAITTWREDNGPFYSVEDLDEVPGIGPAKLEALRDLVTV